MVRIRKGAPGYDDYSNIYPVTYWCFGGTSVLRRKFALIVSRLFLCRALLPR